MSKLDDQIRQALSRDQAAEFDLPPEAGLMDLLAMSFRGRLY